MRNDRNLFERGAFADALKIVAVIGLWFVVCSVDKLPGYDNCMDLV